MNGEESILRKFFNCVLVLFELSPISRIWVFLEDCPKQKDNESIDRSLLSCVEVSYAFSSNEKLAYCSKIKLFLISGTTWAVTLEISTRNLSGSVCVENIFLLNLTETYDILAGCKKACRWLV
jgi:hypothetical protein